VRVDSHLFAGYTVPAHYDSLLGKIIVWGKDRQEALSRMERALAETIITGITHTVPFHRRILQDSAFRRGEVHTGFIADFLDREPVAAMSPASESDGSSSPFEPADFA
jgi:acetyl-CoA carboxylase biotin carboxylase subunit